MMTPLTKPIQHSQFYRKRCLTLYIVIMCSPFVAVGDITHKNVGISGLPINGSDWNNKSHTMNSLVVKRLEAPYFQQVRIPDFENYMDPWRMSHSKRDGKPLGYDFILILPGSIYSKFKMIAAKIHAQNTDALDMPLTSLTCKGAARLAGYGGTSTIGEVTLSHGTSCLLHAYWDNGGDPVSYTGATLKRSSDGVYSISGFGVLRGEDAGGTAVPVP